MVRTLGLVLLALHSAGLAAQGSITGTIYDSLSTRAPISSFAAAIGERAGRSTSSNRPLHL
jgi:hypothetical protein